MRFWLLLCLCVASSHASAGLFADEDARKQVQQLEVRIVKLEQALASSDADKEQTIRSMLDMQMQMEALNTELRKLRGQNEEFAHELQDAEKRQKDFYVDLDTRLRRIEAGGTTSAPADSGTGAAAGQGGEERAFDAAYSFYKAENYQNAVTAFGGFLKNYPQSAHEANVLYWMGNSYFLLKDYKSCVSSYESLAGKYPDHPRVAETMLNTAECQLGLRNKTAAKRTLKLLISKFPGSDASDKAKKRLAAIK
ncbi:tol-pal system protein YbgF [Sideroxydans lithotrophicus]|uniref:Cell division coordinator CpoB n=1 Tax=Sideroxydans lithotrophicus (strain ES-1) TaxID=580332 RepID=D5CMS6_SIDLE|nr:tol-pal system protein YbgF [Sideroxydans lithotrophicus]ADE10762.1 tol-pal system protein YbgF [Sideroxydans lithotrophicus ES-1]